MSAERASKSQRPTGISRIILVAAAILALALIVAWGTSQYYGQRRCGQEILLPENKDYVSYADFHWGMEDESEVIFDEENLKLPDFRRGAFRFTCTDDTFFYLNLMGQKLLADHHFLLDIDARTYAPPGVIKLSLLQGKEWEQKIFVSEPSTFPADTQIDLLELEFRLSDNDDEIYRWGENILWADGLRIDIDGLERTRVEIDSIRFVTGVVLDFNIADYVIQRKQKKRFLDSVEADGVNFVGGGRGLRLAKDSDEGYFVTPAIGLGSFNSFYDLRLLNPEGIVETEIRTGEIGENDTDIQWGEWLPSPLAKDIRAVAPKNYFQARFTLLKSGRKRRTTSSFGGFSLRYLDPSPPGLGGPLFGTTQLPVFRENIALDELGIYKSQTAWIRMEYSFREFGYVRFEKALNMLLAHDYNVIVSFDLDRLNPQVIRDIVRQYRQRVHAWELLSSEDSGAPFYTELFREIKEIDPGAVIFPEPATSDYFQDLASEGLYQFATTSGTQEEVLNRGFWWFFVVAILGLLMVVGLGPILGYHFRLGKKEIIGGIIGLLASIVIIIPLVEFSGMARLTLPRDWAQIEIAFNRYLVSAFLQEFVRALLLLLPVMYLVKAGLKDRTAWILVLFVSSILFGLGHLGYPGLTAAEVTGFVIMTSIAGLIFGAVFWATRSLTVVVIIHLLANIFLSTMTTIGPQL